MAPKLALVGVKKKLRGRQVLDGVEGHGRHREPAVGPGVPLGKHRAAELARILAGAEMKEILGREGTEPYVVSPAEAAETIRSEIEEWKKVAARAGIKAE